MELSATKESLPSEKDFFDSTHFPIQTVMRIVWNFVHRLSVSQCKQYTAISTKTDHTVIEYYADCRRACTSWIWELAGRRHKVRV